MIKTNFSRITLTSVSICLLSACAVGPDFMRVGPLSNDTTYLNVQNSATEQNITQWWARIDDPLLNQYVDQLLSDNLQLQEAGERVIQARERISIQTGDLYPSFSTAQSAGRSFVSSTGNRQYMSNFEADLTTAWEIDLFGRMRRNVESARASFQASQFDRNALKQSLVSDLLLSRVAIAINQERLSLAQKNTQNRENLYKVVKRRYDIGAGNVNLSDVYLAENNFNTSQADIFQFERAIAEESYRLDVLLGQKPGTTDPRSKNFPLLPPPNDTASCIPADLLDRRPDLRASELRARAANANIGVAIADLYPRVTLGGKIGVSDTSLSDLFTADQLIGSLLTSITTRLFEGGKLRANIRLRESEARELSATYANNILNALREVETALQAEEKITEELETREKSLTLLKKAEESSQARYLRGVTTLQNYLDIQQQYYQAEQVLLSTQQEKWAIRIALYLALGGDWFDENPSLGKCSEPLPQTDNIAIEAETSKI